VATRRSDRRATLERSGEDSFAKSVLWGFGIAAESGNRVLVDATDFFLRDIHGAAAGCGPQLPLDRTRSAVSAEHEGFPKNTEVDTAHFANSRGAAAGGGA
jgi:hypothetical protein